MPLPPCASGRDIPGPAGMWMSGAADALGLDRPIGIRQCSAVPRPRRPPAQQSGSVQVFFFVVVFVFLLVIIMVFFRHSQYNTLS